MMYGWFSKLEMFKWSFGLKKKGFVIRPHLPVHRPDWGNEFQKNFKICQIFASDFINFLPIFVLLRKVLARTDSKQLPKTLVQRWNAVFLNICRCNFWIQFGNFWLSTRCVHRNWTNSLVVYRRLELFFYQKSPWIAKLPIFEFSNFRILWLFIQIRGLAGSAKTDWVSLKVDMDKIQQNNAEYDFNDGLFCWPKELRYTHSALTHLSLIHGAVLKV